jgi:hypothetical protein
MKKSIAAVFTATLFFLSCSKETLIGEGPVVTETRTAGNFTGISFSIPGEVHFKTDPVYKIEIQAQQNILNVLRTRVNGGVLEIDFPHDVRVRRHEDIVINLSGPTADFFRVSGSGDITVQGDIVTNKFYLEVSGSGNIQVQKAIVADKIDGRISGSGNITVSSGSAKNEELRISGSGNMNMADVPAEKAEKHISGSGDIRVNLSQSLTARISGSGSVYYRGNPSVSTNISGSGTVRPL